MKNLLIVAIVVSYATAALATKETTVTCMEELMASLHGSDSFRSGPPQHVPDQVFDLAGGDEEGAIVAKGKRTEIKSSSGARWTLPRGAVIVGELYHGGVALTQPRGTQDTYFLPVFLNVRKKGGVHILNQALKEAAVVDLGGTCLADYVFHYEDNKLNIAVLIVDDEGVTRLKRLDVTLNSRGNLITRLNRGVAIGEGNFILYLLPSSGGEGIFAVVGERSATYVNVLENRILGVLQPQ